jgi:hypothetical protein
MEAQNFEMYTIAEFDPFAPINFDQLNVYDERNLQKRSVSQSACKHFCWGAVC